jgi:hypothetical protein
MKVRIPIIVALLALAAVTASAQAPAAATHVETIADFDSPINPLETALSGNIGALDGGHTGNTSVTHYEDGGAEGGCLEVAWRFPPDNAAADFAGLWMGLRGHADAPQVSLDLTRNPALRFRVRGKLVPSRPQGPGRNVATVKLELKDDRLAYERTAVQHLVLEEVDTWSTVEVSAQGVNGAPWEFNQDPPDFARAKQLVFVVERRFNAGEGSLWLDDFELVAEGDGVAPADDDAFLEEVARKSFGLFDEYASPELGLVLDRSVDRDNYTIAGTGFGLGALCVAAERGWLTREEAARRARRTLTALEALPQGDAPMGMAGYRGFFYHFLGADGTRKHEKVELSTIDTALLLCGVLACKGAFDAPEEADIRECATRLVGRVDWKWMLTEDDRGRLLFRQGWTPEDGLYEATWDCYTDEVILLNLLAIAANEGKPADQRVPAETFYQWSRVTVTPPEGEPFVATFPGALFTYFFASVWLPPRALDREDVDPEHPVNWWQNSIAAARNNYRYCRAHEDVFGKAAWGLTACAGRIESTPVYNAYGAPPCLMVDWQTHELVQKDDPHPVMLWRGEGRDPTWVDDNTVIAVYGAGSCLPLLSEESLAALRYYREHTDLWRGADLGFGDAYAETDGFVGRAVYSIDAGPMLIAIDNYLAQRKGGEGAVWKALMNTEEIQRALAAVYPK